MTSATIPSVSATLQCPHDSTTTYLLEQEIGHGSFGIVYQGQAQKSHSSTTTTMAVAIKRMEEKGVYEEE